jgi:cyclic pyranopterin monophosphate synthase
MPPDQLSHLDEHGAARMVDISAKPATARVAVATGHIALTPATLSLIASGQAPKGDVLATARIAGIMAAKNTAQLIPLCHPLSLSSVTLDLAPDGHGIAATATTKTTGPTGVEMEALTAVSVALLTLYDMLKAVDRTMALSGIRLVQKTKNA